MSNKIFQKEYRRLNSAQRDAVDTIEGPVMVIAGPGTGKTQILAMRIANILDKTQTNPSNILALTFTNSGVYQMKKRLLEIIGIESYKIHVHTYHSFCNEIIKSYPEKFAKVSEINQLTDLEQTELIKKILDSLDLKFLKPLKAPYLYTKAIIKTVGDLKQEGILPDEFDKLISRSFKNLKNTSDLEYEKGPYKGKVKAKYIETENQLNKNRELAMVFSAYQKELESKSQYDYADMILFILDAFKNDDELLSIYQEKFQYILVDEYQDTNSAQNEIVKVVASFHANPNIFVVGDDEQSIFRFQGASLENILFFSNNYPQTKIIVLKENYRSVQKILDSSRKLIEINKNQIFNLLKIKKELKSQNKKDGKIWLGHFLQGSTENYFVSKEIQKILKTGTKPSEIAVIYKEHRDGVELVENFSKLDIPYQMEVGNNILLDPEISKIVNILFLLEDLNDDRLIFNVLHFPFFNIPQLDIYKIANGASREKKHLFEVITTNKKLNFEKPLLIKKFVSLLLKGRANFSNKTFVESFDLLINQSGYLNYLLKLPESIHHLNRLQDLFLELKLLNLKNKKLNLTDFRNYLTSLEENNIIIKESLIDANFEGVRLMTAHKSKGNEFETVFIIHCTDNHWGNSKKRRLIKLPEGIIHFQNVQDENDEEERRLFYVALTRAKQNIYITYADNYAENDDLATSIPSKFIEEIDSKNLQLIDSKKYEKDFKQKILLGFAPKKWHPRKNFDDFVETLIENFRLSATSLNAYLECPYKFFLNQLVRVPKVKDFTQSYGTAVHKALELFFKKYQNDLKLPKKTDLINYFIEGLKAEIMTGTDQARALKWGIDHLEKYYDFYFEEWLKNGPPLSLEYSFYYHKVRFENIPITGKIDKIELLDKVSGSVRITDYKTSSPKSLNELMGLTKSKNQNELFQAYFYKLLSEQDPLFSWNVTEIMFDFLSPAKEKFKRVVVPIEKERFEEFKNLVKEVYKNIRAKKFNLEPKLCINYDKLCEYYNLCHKKEIPKS